MMAGASKNLSKSALISALKISLAMNGNLAVRGLCLLVTPVVGSLLLGHIDDIIYQVLQLVVVKATRKFAFLLVDQLVVQVLELLEDVVIVEQAVDAAVLAAEQLFDRSGTLLPVVCPEGAS